MGKRGPKPRFLDVAYPNEQFNLFGIAGKGNVTVYGTYKISSGKVRKYVCHTCGTRFCDRTNTAFYDSRTNEEKIKLALKMAMRAIERKYSIILMSRSWKPKIRIFLESG